MTQQLHQKFPIWKLGLEGIAYSHSHVARRFPTGRVDAELGRVEHGQRRARGDVGAPQRARDDAAVDALEGVGDPAAGVRARAPQTPARGHDLCCYGGLLFWA